MRNRASTVAAYAFLSLFFVAFLYPFLWMIASSLKPDLEIVSMGLTSSNYTLGNYLLVFSRAPVVRAFLNSLIVASAVTVSVVLFGAMVGYALAKVKWKGSVYLTAFLLFTMMLPFQLTLIPTYTLIVKLGLTDNLLGLILPNMLTAVAVIMFRQFFQSIPDTILEAARVDGCSEVKVVFKIVMPLAKPAVVTVAIITFLTSWNDVLWPIMVIRERDLMTLPQLVTTFVLGGEAESHLGAKLASATLLAVPIVVFYSFFQRSIVQSFASSGVKG